MWTVEFATRNGFIRGVTMATASTFPRAEEISTRSPLLSAMSCQPETLVSLPKPGP